jgi:hypothetical protein
LYFFTNSRNETWFAKDVAGNPGSLGGLGDLCGKKIAGMA